MIRVGFAVLKLIGYIKHKYKHRFLKTYSKVKNIYLDRAEELSLRSTYIPLHMRAQNKTQRNNV